MNNNKIALYKGDSKADLVKSNNGSNQAGIVKSNNGNSQTDIVKSNEDVEVNILTTLDADTLDKTKRIRNQALALLGRVGISIKTDSGSQ